MLGGSLSISDETTEYSYFSQDDLDNLDVMENHLERVTDAFMGQEMPFLR